MTAHARSASPAGGITPAITFRTSSRRVVVIAASFVLEAVLVLGFVSSSLGLGSAPYPDPDHGWASAAPVVAPAAPVAVDGPSSDGSAPQPAPAPAP